MLFLLVSGTLPAQDSPAPQPVTTPQPVTVGPNLMRLEGVDQASGIHFVRLSLTLPPATSAAQGLPPRFTVECDDNNGKHNLLWFISFGGVPDPGFAPPFRSTQNALFPPRYPSVKLKMTFEGYIKWKPFTKEWSALPSGELRYRNPGTDSPNMESPRYWMQYLNSLPGLRIENAKPGKGDPAELFFQSQPLLNELKKSPECEP
jgi:hypothetical protein